MKHDFYRLILEDRLQDQLLRELEITPAELVEQQKQERTEPCSPSNSPPPN